MTTSKVIWLVVMSLAFYVCGALFIFRTSMLVEWAKKNYGKRKLDQAYPFSGIVTKPWYPAFIRVAGIFIWLWALVVDYLVLFRGFR
jgi:hypothetical protein